MEDWIEQSDEEGLDGLDVTFDDYQVSTSPNDFNISSLVDFIDKGVLRIPGFQRNYVWDMRRASKLIESLVLGLPIPQIFLYEIDSKFYVIDGQQRLMTLYFFKKGRFPRKDKRTDFRSMYVQSSGQLMSTDFANNDLFQDFKLSLSKDTSGKKNKLQGLSYHSFGDLQLKFDLKTIRSMTIKQNAPENDDSSMYEIFNRLNTGGVSLAPQEIRLSMYHSKFYELLSSLNLDDDWRTLLKQESPDLHMKDMELLLRGIGMVLKRGEYSPSMVGFLNRFSKQMKKSSDEDLVFIKDLFRKFFSINKELDLYKSNRLNVTLFEAVFYSATYEAWGARDLTKVREYTNQQVSVLKSDEEFTKLISSDTTGKVTVNNRLDKACIILNGKIAE